MLDVSALEKFDSQRMHKVYDMWPQIALDSFKTRQDEIHFEGIDHIVFAGMGGSGALGDIIASILSKTGIHTSVIKGYLLPKTVDSDTLVITTSVSGNTQEVLTILKNAQDIGCKKVVAFSSGGKIKDYSIKHAIEFRDIPKTHSPRASFVSFLFSMLSILKPVIPMKDSDVYETIDELKIQNKVISSHNLSESNPAITLAKWMNGIPLIYYPSGLQAAAIRFKNSMQENVKMHAIAEDIIESCHNGIVSWERKSNVQPILLEGKDDYYKTKERYGIIKNYFDEKNISYQSISSVNGSILSKLVNLIYFLDYASIYRAILSEIDPSPVESIGFIKGKLDE